MVQELDGLRGDRDCPAGAAGAVFEATGLAWCAVSGPGPARSGIRADRKQLPSGRSINPVPIRRTEILGVSRIVPLPPRGHDRHQSRLAASVNAAEHLAPRVICKRPGDSDYRRCRFSWDFENVGWPWRRTLRLQQRPQRLRPRYGRCWCSGGWGAGRSCGDEEQDRHADRGTELGGGVDDAGRAPRASAR